jgi:hypothetical protein
MTTLAIAAIAIVVVLVLLAITFKALWKVPAADEALIITGVGVKGRAVGDRIFKIITGGGAFVVPVLQKAQYLGMSADTRARASSTPSRARCTTWSARSSTATCARSSARCRSRT